MLQDDKIYTQGRNANRRGWRLEDNPYCKYSLNAYAWELGWLDQYIMQDRHYV